MAITGGSYFGGDCGSGPQGLHPAGLDGHAANCDDRRQLATEVRLDGLLKMSPIEYFPALYRCDLAVFAGSAEIPLHGPFGALCGMTVGNLFEPAKRNAFKSASGFLCTQYALNLLDQAVYTYHPSLLSTWRLRVDPFVDIRGCHAGHGGWTHQPRSVLAFARRPSHVPRAQPVELEDELPAYVRFFFFDYLPSVLDAANHESISPTDLLGALQRDPDCNEIGNIMG